MWLLFAACAPPSVPADAGAPVAPALEDPAPPWVLVGRSSSEGLDTPTLAGGAAALGAGCRAVNERLHGDGPPCFVEEWRAGGSSVRVERAGARLTFDGRRGRTSWSPIGGPLATCLGDPLLLPPAGDPGARRALEDGAWVLTLSGDNHCGLGGTVRLDVLVDRAEWRDVTVGGAPWNGGGREAARELLRAELRATVADRWDELGADQRAEALRVLAEDPHPEALELLRKRGGTRGQGARR